MIHFLLTQIKAKGDENSFQFPVGLLVDVDIIPIRAIDQRVISYLQE